MQGLRRLRPFAVLLVLVLLSALAYGFTAQNSMPSELRAGQGENGISGFEVSNIHYSLLSGFSNRLTALTFDLDAPDPSDTEVHARFPASAGGTGDWKTCELLVAPNTWICSGFAEFVADVNSLEVVAAQ